ncbi:MerR HTH family regulatory protein [Desulfatibacillum alkenivorans DSM 16219]|jgi:DNA-binding transcriptional MerR regulator|uniref:MerR HTH family regulatory protein n=1 Tax=Desulfatibacillum alkenivorans DSM 16219 TaxID=1121393 RepID=A0A1M6YKP2_9BACT|nr:MerR family transcriptional regulator [Desulfatibacillum alkenivorans]SHL18818.1 MerR HTH family regulatory protein [Desulfatibacillum alkenivorans DSM 16219]
MDQDLYSKSQAAKLLGITPRTIHYYTDLGLVVPKINPTGKGTTRWYSVGNLFELMFIKELASSGISLESIKYVIDQLSRRVDSPIDFNLTYNVGTRTYLLILDWHTDHARAFTITPNESGMVEFGLHEAFKAMVVDITRIWESVANATGSQEAKHYVDLVSLKSD